MTHIDYCYFSPLANAQGPFRSLKLPEPFKVERWPQAKIVRLWRQLAWMPQFEIEIQTQDRQVVPIGCASGHVIVGTVRHKEMTSLSDRIRWHEELEKIEEPLSRQLRLIGLYLCGQVDIAASYWYTIESSNPVLTYGGMNIRPLKEFPATIYRNTIEATNEFIGNNKLPLSPDYLQTALEHWEEAHRATQPYIEFFSLMVALETLFNVGAQDIRYRVSRSVAVLLGQTPEDADSIFESVKEAYDVRSKLVHTGRAKGLEKLEVWTLRRLVQQAILRLNDLKMSKDELSARLTRLGFGQGSLVVAKPMVD